MDTITHTAIGACLGEVIAGRQLGKKAMLIGAIANNLPDVDVISHLWASETRALLLHRGITHSILLCTLFTVLLAYLLHLKYRYYQFSYRRSLLLVGSGLYLHILLDAFTTYGTGWFEPFSQARISFNAIFILDPFFMTPVLLGFIALLLLRRLSAKRKAWAYGALTLSSLYLLFVVTNKLFVNHVVKKNLRAQQIAADDYIATPTPLNNVLWYVLIRSAQGYHIGYYSLLDKTDHISFEYFERNDSLLQGACPQEELDDLIRFSQNYYRATLVNDTVIFSDLRFGQIGGWYKPEAPFVFSFQIAQHCSHKTSLQKGRFQSIGTETTLQLVRRIRGISDQTRHPKGM